MADPASAPAARKLVLVSMMEVGLGDKQRANAVRGVESREGCRPGGDASLAQIQPRPPLFTLVVCLESCITFEDSVVGIVRTSVCLISLHNEARTLGRLDLSLRVPNLVDHKSEVS
jgi:hypothetical protein